MVLNKVESGCLGDAVDGENSTKVEWSDSHDEELLVLVSLTDGADEANARVVCSGGVCLFFLYDGSNCCHR